MNIEAGAKNNRGRRVPWLGWIGDLSVMLVIAATLMTCMLVHLKEGCASECRVCGVMMVLVVMGRLHE